MSGCRAGAGAAVRTYGRDGRTGTAPPSPSIKRTYARDGGAPGVREERVGEVEGRCDEADVRLGDELVAVGRGCRDVLPVPGRRWGGRMGRGGGRERKKK